jgi:acetate kinase
MGFSPLEGLMMATRAGNIDAAAVLFLIEEAGFSPSELNRVLNERSGLLGVSGESADLRTLLASSSPGAQLAVSMFCHRLRLFVGAYLAILGGADAILFGGGIGQHAPQIRAGALDSLSWAGIELDAERNEAVSAVDGGPIHRDGSRVEIWVTPTDEARIMTRAAHELLRPPAARTTSEDRP